MYPTCVYSELCEFIHKSQGFQIFDTSKCFEVDLAFIMFSRVLRILLIRKRVKNKVHLQVQLPKLVLEVSIIDCLVEKLNLSQSPLEEML